MVAGISGASPGSVGGALDDVDKLMPPPHAPSKAVSADAAASLATVRALRELIIAFPCAILWQILGRSRPAANRKTPARAMTSDKNTPLIRIGFRGSILYWPLEGLNPLVCLTGAAPSHIPRLLV